MSTPMGAMSSPRSSEPLPPCSRAAVTDSPLPSVRLVPTAVRPCCYELWRAAVPRPGSGSSRSWTTTTPRRVRPSECCTTSTAAPVSACAGGLLQHLGYHATSYVGTGCSSIEPTSSADRVVCGSRRRSARPGIAPACSPQRPPSACWTTVCVEGSSRSTTCTARWPSAMASPARDGSTRQWPAATAGPNQPPRPSPGCCCCRSCRRWCRRSRCAPRDGRVVARFDLGDEHARLVVDMDGKRGHAGAAMVAKDRRRDRGTEPYGWRTERGSWFEVRCRQQEFVSRVVAQHASWSRRAA